MYNEVLPGFYLCKLQQGVAHYLIEKEVYDVYHTKFNAQSAQQQAIAYHAQVCIQHLLGSQKYNSEFHKIRLLNWEELPKSYQLDAIATNEAIRRKYHESIYGAQNNEMSQLKDKLFSLVDDTTGRLRYLASTGTTLASRGVVSYPLKDVSFDKGQDEVAWGTSSTSHITQDLAKAGVKVVDNQLTNNTNNSSMNLFNNMPGLNMDFGKLPAGKLAISMNGDVAFNKNGSYVTIQTDGTEKTRLEVGDFKLDVDFYKVPVQQDGLVEGDIILLDGDFLIVGKKANGETKFINPITGATTNKLQRNNIIGMYFYTKIVSLFDMVGGETKGIGLGGLDPMTLMLLTQGTGNSIGGSTNGGMDLGMMLVMSQLGGAKGGDMSSMLPLMMLSGKGGDMNSMLPLLLMSKGGGGLGNLFGGKKKIAPKAVVTKKKAPAKKTVAKG